jgi:hypothetical protein
MASRRTDALAESVRSHERLVRHRYGELVEAIAEHESFVTRVWFGCLACYLHGRLAIVLADGEPPWDGVLVPTTAEHHASLRRALPALRRHPVLGKWLYLRPSAESFEDDAGTLATMARADDARLGVVPRPRRAIRVTDRGRRRPAAGRSR